MEITQEILHSELSKIRQEIASCHRNFITWVVSLFLGTSLLMTALGSIFINIVLQ